MGLRTAQILFKDERAGTLQETARGGTRFTYDSGWRQPIACCFGTDRREHEWPQGLHPFFQHLGTEGWLRERQARISHIDQEDDLGLLLRHGGDCIGAVSVKPEGALIAPVLTEATGSTGRTVSGVQKKLLVVRLSDGTFVPAGAAGPAPYIAKFSSNAITTLVRNERLSLQWTSAVLGGKEVNAFTVASVKGQDSNALIVTRFDRTPSDVKLRLEDFAQILAKPRGVDYRGKYDASYEDVAGVIKGYSVRPAIDLARFFRRLVLFAVVGNCDAHLKNFSLLETPAGLRLSPAYDVLNTLMYPEYDRNLALSIGGHIVSMDRVDPALLRAFGRSIGIAPRALDDIFATLRRKVQAAATILTPPLGEPPDGFVHRFQEIVSNACLRILP
jgi:serine/threonine-protein kinase HipA